MTAGPNSLGKFDELARMIVAAQMVRFLNATGLAGGASKSNMGKE